MYAQRRRSTASHPVDRFAVPLDELPDLTRCVGGGAGHRNDAFEEEGKPFLPSAVRPDSLQVVVVRVTMLLEVQAQVEQRLLEDLLRTQQQRDEQAADAAVAVKERMDRLELHVSERRLDQQR